MLLLGALAATLQAQEPAQEPEAQAAEALPAVDPRIQDLEGKTIREIRVARLGDNGQLIPLEQESADRIVRGLASKSGQPLQRAKVTADVSNLWTERRLVVAAFGVEQDDGVVLVLAIMREDEVYERVEFKGLKHLTVTEVEELLGLHPDRRVTRFEAIAMRNVLLARYRRDGYAFCSIDFEELPAEQSDTAGNGPRKVLRFRIDEGVQVTVRHIYFRGNRAFPGRAHLGFVGGGDVLVRDSGIQSGPAWALTRGDPFSREVLQEDLDRLRVFYRSRGYLDAEVELASYQFSEDQSEVDLSILVIEGPRYRIDAVELLRVDRSGEPVPEDRVYYPAAEVRKVLRVEPGDYYDSTAIARDLRALQDFYGARGHPSRGEYGLDIEDAFTVHDPLERFTDDARVELTYVIEEGTPKTLRDVLIRGNTYTRDEVIRRKVYAFPGQRLDMTEVRRSVRFLEATRFFQDRATLRGPQFRLLQVPGHPDYLDLGIDVLEGETGEFRWGVGVSTGAGFQGSLQFNKRNFDLFKLPSSADPGTVFSEILDSKAFHGGGQQLDLLLAPGTQISQFNIGFTEPDLFGTHFDTIGLRVNGRRRVRRFRDGYTADTLGVDLGFTRQFDEVFSAGLSFRQETVEVKDIDASAITQVFDAEGQTEMRGARFSLRWRDVDDVLTPSEGYDLLTFGELVGGPFGAEEDFYKAQINFDYYLPLWEDDLGRRHVLHFEQQFGYADAFDDSRSVFLTERYYMGGRNLRGFDFRDAGPSQFGHPVGGEAIYTASLEYFFPLVSTRGEGQIRETELLRGVLFTDFGLLGLTLDDPTFREPRLSVGVGVRISIPLLGLPIALDLGWPILYEETDDRRQLFFSISR